MIDFLKKIPLKISDNNLDKIKESTDVAIFNGDNIYVTIIWYIYLKEVLKISNVYIYFNTKNIKNSEILTINLSENNKILAEYIDDIISVKSNVFYIIPLILNIISRYNILILLALYKGGVDYSNNVTKNMVRFLVSDIEDNGIILESVRNLIYLLSERKSLDTYGFYTKIFNILDVCETYLGSEFIFNIISNKFYGHENIIPDLYSSIKTEFIKIQNTNINTGDYNEEMRNALSKYFFYIKGEITQIGKILNKYETIYNYFDGKFYKNYVYNKKTETPKVNIPKTIDNKYKILDYSNKRFTIFELHRIYKEYAPFGPGNNKPFFKFIGKFVPYDAEKNKFAQNKKSKNGLKYSQYRFITNKGDNIVINDFDNINIDFKNTTMLLLDIIYPAELNSKNKLSFILKKTY